MRLDGKTALITGGVSGIGKATALEFARIGAKVICADVASVDAAAKDVLARHDKVDIQVNSAGWDRIQPLLENTQDFMDRVLAINLRGPIRLTQALLPAMAASGYGKIVNVASDAGRVGSLGETVYAGAKGGMIAFTKSLAREVARYKITVN